MKLSCATFLSPILLVTVLFASCAQINTHDNIRTAGQYYEGYQLTKPKNIYLSEGTWYIKADKYKVKKNYIFYKISSLSRDYFFETSGNKQGTVYLPLDKDKAKTLLTKSDNIYLGIYYIQKNSNKIKDYLPIAEEQPVLVKNVLLDSNSSYVGAYDENKEFKQNKAYLGLSFIDQVLVDLPASIVTNTIIYTSSICIFPYLLIFRPDVLHRF